MLFKETTESLSSASFQIPHYFCQSAWIEHAPFAFWLMNALRPQRFVELGTHNGYSYFTFCQSIDSFETGTAAFAVDTWLGDEHAGFYDNSVYETVLAANERYSGFSRLIRATFKETAEYFSDESIDLIHIDGRHFYSDVKEDYESWLPKLTKGAIVLFHDTNVRDKGFGVWKFFEELSSKHRSFQFNHGNGLGVLAQGAIPEPLAALFAASGPAVDQIRTVYSALGGLLVPRRRLTARTEALAEMLKEGADVSLNAAETLARISDWDPQIQTVRSAIERYKTNALALRESNETLLTQIERSNASAKASATNILELQQDNARLRDNLSRENARLRDSLSQENACLRDSQSREKAAQEQLAVLLNSTSWRLTRPVRRLAKAWTASGQIFKRLTARRQALALHQSTPKIKAHSLDESIVASPQIPAEVARPIEIDYSVSVPFDLSEVSNLNHERIAAIIHIHYEELAGEFRLYLSNVPVDLDIYISTTDSFRASVIEKAFSGWSKGRVEVRLVPNRGRDIAPKLVTFSDVYERYAYVVFLHSKRSKHAGVLASWRHFLLENLVGSPEVVTSVLDLFNRAPKIGIVASQHFEPMRHWVNWGDDFTKAEHLAARMGFSLNEHAPLDFPSGSMFWARTAALKPLLDLRLKSDEFDLESNQKDGTLAHAIERVFFHACEHAGFDWIKIARPALYENTPGIVTVSPGADLSSFLDRYVFRLLDPQGVFPRTVGPSPVEKAPSRLFEYVQDRALGLRINVSTDLRVAIGLVTYNNGTEELTRAVGAAEVSLKSAGLSALGSLFLLDNGSSTENSIPASALVTRLPTRGNIGFGSGHNLLMRTAFEQMFDIYIAINPDGMLHPNSVKALAQMILATEGKALIEALQFPSEHPKPYDEHTLDTPWVSAACLAISKCAFYDLGGFDEDFFMYCEDVDLSWRARANGYALKTCASALFLHAVTNREMKPATLKMIFDSGIILARKWGSPDFEKWIHTELAARGFSPLHSSPVPVPDEWRRCADFSHHFTFAEPRW